MLCILKNFACTLVNLNSKNCVSGGCFFFVELDGETQGESSKYMEMITLQRLREWLKECNSCLLKRNGKNLAYLAQPQKDPQRISCLL